MFFERAAALIGFQWAKSQEQCKRILLGRAFLNDQRPESLRAGKQVERPRLLCGFAETLDRCAPHWARNRGAVAERTGCHLSATGYNGLTGAPKPRGIWRATTDSVRPGLVNGKTLPPSFSAGNDISHISQNLVK